MSLMADQMSGARPASAKSGLELDMDAEASWQRVWGRVLLRSEARDRG